MTTVYEHVAWMGGSFSPPTTAHHKVALQMGEALNNITSEGSRSCVCIVPVSGAYNKASIQCFSDQNKRWAMAEAMLQSIKNNNKLEKVDFKLLDYEFKSDKPVTTFDSLGILRSQPFCNNNTNIFIAQGQDNIEAIMRREWANSNALLSDYRMLMYPRGQNTDKESLREHMMDLMMTEKGKQKPESTKLTEDKAKAVFDNLIIVGDGFNDETSSTGVRKKLYSNTNISSDVDPEVKAVIDKEGIKDIYASCEALKGERNPQKGGRRKRKTRKQKKRKQTKKKFGEKFRRNSPHPE